jgi:hypothetical protein
MTPTSFLELQRLRREGLAVGLSVSGPRQADSIRYALGVEVNRAPLFQVVQADVEST